MFLKIYLPQWRPSVDVQSCLVVGVEGTDYFWESEGQKTFYFCVFFFMQKPPANSAVALREVRHTPFCQLIGVVDLIE